MGIWGFLAVLLVFCIGLIYVISKLFFSMLGPLTLIFLFLTAGTFLAWIGAKLIRSDRSLMLGIVFVLLLIVSAVAFGFLANATLASGGEINFMMFFTT